MLWSGRHIDCTKSLKTLRYFMVTLWYMSAFDLNGILLFLLLLHVFSTYTVPTNACLISKRHQVGIRTSAVLIILFLHTLDSLRSPSKTLWGSIYTASKIWIFEKKMWIWIFGSNQMLIRVFCMYTDVWVCDTQTQTKNKKCELFKAENETINLIETTAQLQITPCWLLPKWSIWDLTASDWENNPQVSLSRSEYSKKKKKETVSIIISSFVAYGICFHYIVRTLISLSTQSGILQYKAV